MNASPATFYAFKASPLNKIWANTDDQSTPTTLYYSDGTTVTSDENYKIQDGNVYIYGEQAEYNQSFNIVQLPLYCWRANDGLTWQYVYTNTDTISSLDTPLFTNTGETYTGTDFSIVPDGSGFAVAYLNRTAEYYADGYIPSETLYAYITESDPRYIWSNYITAPTILYDEKGNIYTGTEWYISDGQIYFNGTQATADSLKDISSFAIPVVSGLIGSNGSPTQTINSNVGVVTVIKQALTKEQMRNIALNFSSTLGENPCINAY